MRRCCAVHMLREAELDLLACACAGDLGVISALSLLSREAADALQRLVEARGDAMAAIEAMERTGMPLEARLLRDASTRTPPACVEDAVASLQAARAVERWRRAAQAILRLCSSGAQSPQALLTQIEAAVVPALYAQAATGTLQTADRLVERFIERYAADEREQVIPSGLEAIDSRIGGWRRGHLHLVCGLTGIGKTSLLVQTAMHAVRAGFRAHFVSGELPADDLVPRLLGDELGEYLAVDGSRPTVLRVLRRDPDVLEILQAAYARGREALARLVVDARGWVSLQEATSAFAACHALAGVDVLLVDYLQLLHGNGRNHSREREVAETAEVLKRLAMRHNVAVVAAAQLVDPPAWGPEQQRSGAPAVRESRAAAHAADMVVELHLERENREGNSRGEGTSYVLRITKSRHFAPPEPVRLVFDRSACRFRELGPTTAETAAPQ